MANPYSTPKAPVVDGSSRRFSLRNATAAFLCASVLVPAAFFGAAWLLLGVRPDGQGNLGFWSLILGAAAFGAAMVGRIEQCSALTASLIGVATVFVIAVAGIAAFVAWSLATEVAIRSSGPISRLAIDATAWSRCPP